MEGRPSLDIIYKYDSSGRLIYKAQNNGIVYYYLRDKDGHLMHKIIRNTITGAEEDGIVFGPYFSEVDPDGFKLIRYGDREELLVKDLEGNSRYLIEIFDALRNKLSFQQRDAATDGDYFPNNEILMNAILEKKWLNRNMEYLYFLSKVFDFSLDPSMGSPAEALMRAEEAACCYRDGCCTPACGMCFGDCYSTGRPDSGGGSYGCDARIAGPPNLYKDQTVPSRWDFDASPAAFQNLLATPGYGTDHRWRILAELNTHATESNETAQSAYHISQISFNSGYRCPSGNALVGGAAASNHQLGQAFDFSGTSLNIWKSYLAALDNGAASDTYLLRNGKRYFWSDNPPPASSTVVYTLGHAAWN